MSVKKPIIGVSGSLQPIKDGPFFGYKQTYVNHNYIQSVVNAGGVPFVIPVITESEMISQLIEHLDGLVLTGGHDVNPLLYGEEPQEKLGEILPVRDAFDQMLVKAAVAAGKPVLAICRGIQVMNVAFGGSLYQDLSYNEAAFVKHSQAAGPDIGAHTITVEKDSLLEKIIGPEIVANSFHHQAVKEVAPGFLITATAKDGVVETIEKQDAEFVLGVQFHPEMMSNSNEYMLNLFKALVGQAQKVYA